jgi:hypothetical protein
MEKATTSRSWLGAGTWKPASSRTGATDSTTPRISPPTAAPVTLPMPPRTAAVNALMPGTKPMLYWTMPNTRANITPATPARIPPTAKVVTITRLTLIPIRLAISLSSATARMALPVRVLEMNQVRAAIMTAAATTVTSRALAIGMPRIVQVPSRAAMSG